MRVFGTFKGDVKDFVSYNRQIADSSVWKDYELEQS